MGEAGDTENESGAQMKLEQSTALRPFVGKLIMPAIVAWLTGYHKFRWVIRAATSERYYMIYLVLVQLVTAPIALALLSFELCLNILGSVCTWSRHFTSATIAIIGKILLWMLHPIFTQTVFSPLRIGIAVALLLLMCFFDSRCVVVSLPQITTRLTLRFYAAFPITPGMKVFCCGWERLFTGRTISYLWERFRGLRRETTLPTSGMQAINAVGMSMKELKSGRPGGATINTVLVALR